VQPAIGLRKRKEEKSPNLSAKPRMDAKLMPYQQMKREKKNEDSKPIFSKQKSRSFRPGFFRNQFAA
jgi:hypothetical protein